MEQKEETKMPDFFKLPDSFVSFCDKLLFELGKEAIIYFKLKGPEAVNYRKKYYLKFYQILIRCSLEKQLDEKSDLRVVQRVMETLVIMYHVFNKFSEFKIDKTMNEVMVAAVENSRRTYNRVRQYHNIVAMDRANFEGKKPKLWPTWLELVRPLERKWHNIRIQNESGYKKATEKVPINERRLVNPFSYKKKYKKTKITKRKIAGTHIQYLVPPTNMPLLKL